MICQATRTFSNPDVVHVNSRVDPASDIETIQTELTLANIQTSEKQIPRLRKEVRGKKTEPIILKTTKEALALLEKGELLSRPASTTLDQDTLKSFQLMMTKPSIFVFNTDQVGTEDEALQQPLCDLVTPAEAVLLDAQFESELVELDGEDVHEMLEDSGQTEAGFDKLTRVGFVTLGLQTYLTAGPKKARAWTVYHGDTTLQAAGVIHTDSQCGFIKAEIVSYDNLAKLGGMQEVCAVGKVRIEGKGCVMADDDIVEFKFNV